MPRQPYYTKQGLVGHAVCRLLNKKGADMFRPLHTRREEKLYLPEYYFSGIANPIFLNTFAQASLLRNFTKASAAALFFVSFMIAAG